MIDKEHQLKATRFYDDNADPYQLNNLPIDKNAPEVQTLLKEMAYWLKHSDDP